MVWEKKRWQYVTKKAQIYIFVLACTKIELSQRKLEQYFSLQPAHKYVFDNICKF